MKKAAAAAAGLIVAVAIGLVVVVSSQPAVTHVERSVTIDASPGDVFPFLNDYANWGEWSPWDDKDPDMTITMSTPSAGVGATYEWQGNQDVGKGRMEILASADGTSVTHDLHFMEPWESKAVVTHALVSGDDSVTMTWGMDTENGFMAKAMSLMMDMDAMIGPDFEHGLAMLKQAAEKAAAERAEAERVAAEAAAEAARAHGEGAEKGGAAPGAQEG